MNKSFKRPGKFQEKSEFDSSILDLARVTRVTEGGKHMSFRALVVIGDRKGRVGFAVDKGKDVQISVDKATRKAKKNLIKVPMTHDTIPHMVTSKFKASKVMLKPAPRGSGIIAGGAVRSVLELAGVPNVSSKILGKTKNKITIVKATFEALKTLRQPMKKQAEKTNPTNKE
ncbi:MAG: ribosomal protein S5 [uncultured bacterium]|nr:MAG: ribosomal protein S5 [uncultured bacterium]